MIDNGKNGMYFIIACIVLFFCYIAKNREKNEMETTKKATTYPNPSGKNRGLKNNNPLNIRKSNDKFVGEIQPSGDAAFKQFESTKYGYRAAFRILNSYIKNGNNTIEKIVSRWAPSSDGNNTSSYIEHVEQRSGINRTKTIETENEKLRIIQAMTQSETGIKPTLAELKEAYKII